MCVCKMKFRNWIQQTPQSSATLYISYLSLSRACTLSASTSTFSLFRVAFYPSSLLSSPTCPRSEYTCSSSSTTYFATPPFPLLSHSSAIRSLAASLRSGFTRRLVNDRFHSSFSPSYSSDGAVGTRHSCSQ